MIGYYLNNMGFLLFIIAYVLWLPLTVLNFFVVWKKGYFKSTAISIDKFGNREFRTLFNRTLVKKNGYRFGDERETVSSALGKNQRDKTLTRLGKIICGILDFLDKNHCKKSIKEF